ncbi:sigma-70 family RNA polymerase sigma factor [Pedobacter frigiditerrae]|uniref:Sigma-70 family RNA polymerase sigma factor n=1 Tax=Pedobacter frigiditerrae TaxID=2530452 RepID=A0A4R0MYF5_9SPHI|nr:sigma-70 family RNA polymerase sigma factor [Pedobacter frigiditerrae]TCC91957.1 sigma-70 family RNA polymerase sigma factor [Pedobacter frigiditerrae]
MADKNLKTDPNLWVALYADKLYRFALKKVFSEELAKDLVQETFLAALQGMQSFKGESTELTWLTAILKNKIIDSYKKKKLPIEQLTDDVFFEHDGHWKSQPLEIGINESNPLENKELGKVLEECMKKLPALWLTVFSLKYVDDSSTELICSSLSITAANYWVIVHRSKLSLRACLQKHWL